MSLPLLLIFYVLPYRISLLLPSFGVRSVVSLLLTPASHVQVDGWQKPWGGWAPIRPAVFEVLTGWKPGFQEHGMFTTFPH